MITLIKSLDAAEWAVLILMASVVIRFLRKPPPIPPENPMEGATGAYEPPLIKSRPIADRLAKARDTREARRRWAVRMEAERIVQDVEAGRMP